MSFSTDLLDGFENLNKRTEGVLKTIDNTGNFFRNLSKIEREYGKSLAKLASSQRQSNSKAPPSQKELGTTYAANDSLLAEVERMAEVHNSLADKLENEIYKSTQNFVKEKSRNRKKLESDGQRITKEYKTAIQNLEKARSKYVQLSKEADEAEAQHQKGKADMQMKPSNLAKLAGKSQQCAEKVQQSNNEYQSTLGATNAKQSEFYKMQQPALLQEYHAFEEEHLTFLKSISEQYAQFNSEKAPAYTNSVDVVKKSVASIDIKNDISQYVAENKTGVSNPKDIDYVAYDAANPIADIGAPRSTPPPTSKNAKPTNPGKIGKYQGPVSSKDPTAKEWGLSASDAILTPQEQATKLSAQLQELDKLVTSETKSKDGLENLVRFYASDPTAQAKAQSELNDTQKKLDKLHDAKSLVQEQLNSAKGGKGVTPSSASSHSAPSGPRTKVRALYNYEQTNDTELSFKEGEILSITEQDPSGWWYAMNDNGTEGFVPHNYVELVRK